MAERERSYLTELCKERGIEIEVLGIKRDNYSLPEYKAIMQKVDTLEQQAEALAQNNEFLENHNEGLNEEFVKFFTPKSMKQKMEEARVRAMEYNHQRKIAKTEQMEKNYWQHEL